MQRNNHTERRIRPNLHQRPLSKVRITPDNIAQFAYPVAQFIHEEKPNYVLGIDSGGRIPAMAVFKLYSELYGAFPTDDRLMHFKRISHSMSRDTIREQLKPTIDQVLSTSTSPHLLIIDDCINTGATTLLLRTLTSELSQKRVQLSIGVMREFLIGLADVSGDTFSLARAEWRNRPEMIGLTYPDGREPVALRNQEALKLRRQVYKKISEFVRFRKE